MIDSYNPEVAPDSVEWLELDESERLYFIEQYHREARVPLPKNARRMHAVIHTIVENQLALEDQEVVRSTLLRLMQDGLTRHEAIHAIGSVLAEHMHNVLQKESVPPEGHAPYYAALQQLTAEKWRNL